MNSFNNLAHQNTQLPSTAFIIKIVVIILMILSITTQGKLDPTFFNLLTPPDGISNIFGLIGSLIGGTLSDFFGISILFIFLIFLVLSKKPSENNGVFTIKLFVMFLLINTTCTAFIFLKQGDVSYYFGLWGITSAQMLLSQLGITGGLTLTSTITALYILAISKTAKPDWVVFHFFIFIGVFILAGFQRVGIQLFNTTKQVEHFISSQIINLWTKTHQRVQGYFKNKKYILAKHLGPLKQSKSAPQTKQYQKTKTSVKKHTELVFHSKTKQLLHQAIAVYQKTNYPGNDTEINSLDN